MKVYFMASEYRENYWKDLSNCYPESSIKIEGIPQDIINVLDGTIGEETIDWIDRPLQFLDHKTARELVKTEEGCKALKAFIMRMPR